MMISKRWIRGFAARVSVKTSFGAVSGLAAALLANLGAPAPLQAGELFGRGFVGIRATVTDIRPGNLEVDFNVTAYTRHVRANSGPPSGSSVYIRTIDFGDGQTQSRATLPLATVSAVPGPVNVHVYRRSFTHTYPGLGDYRLTVASSCFCCSARHYRSRTTAPTVITSYTRSPFFPIVTGNAFSLRTKKLTTTFNGQIRRRYYQFLLQLTNTAGFTIAPVPEVPTLSEWAMISLGLGLAMSGVVMLWRQRFATR